MTKKEKDNRRKSFFDSLPSYLAGFAAVATATVAVLTYLHNRDVASKDRQETTSGTEPEVDRGHVGAIPSFEVAPARATSAGNVSATAAPGTNTAGNGATRVSPTLESALRPTRCSSYVGTWKLSSGDLMSLLNNDRVEFRGTAGAPRFGRWSCSGRNEEIFYLSLDREQHDHLRRVGRQ